MKTGRFTLGFAYLRLSNEEAQHFYRRRHYVDAGALLLPGEPLEIIFVKEL